MRKKTNKKAAKPDHSWIWLLVTAAAILLAVVLLVWLLAGNGNGSKPGETTTPTTAPVKIEKPEKVNIDLGYGMRIVDVAKYTGAYMEDGTNEVLSGLLMIVVQNTGDKDIQYAEIEMPVNDKIAYFKLTTLPAGESMVVLEKSRMKYERANYTSAVSRNVALFQTPMSLCKDMVEIQTHNGTINVINVSGADIEGNVIVYYKNSSADMLYGGITYRCVISGGIKKDEIRQIRADHFTTAGSRVMFVTCG